MASTTKSGHGATIDLGVVDEAFSYQDARIEQAMRPAMMTRRSAQLWVVSTAGTPAASPYLLERVERGRHAVEAGLTSGLCYFEWSAADDADPGDPETWRGCMPALARTVTEEVVHSAFRSMARHEFERAFLNRWVTALGEPVVPIEEWEALADPDGPRPSEVVLAVDVAPGSKSAAIVRPGSSAGTCACRFWKRTRARTGSSALQRLATGLGATEVIADARSAAPLLTGFRGAALTSTSATDMAVGATFLLDLVKNKRLRHRGERELTIAIDGAARRPLGDSFAWSRKSSAVDISPLVAVTLAAWAFHGSWAL